MGRPAAAAILAALAGLAFALRAVGHELVFVGDAVVLAPGDGPYHARLAAFAFGAFPGFLSFDPYLAGPLGGAVPWPPLFDLLVAGVARLLGTPAEGTDAVLAWSGPVLGAVTVPMVYAAARVVAGRATALGAAALQALFPIAIEYSAVGYGDHHAFVSAIGAGWLALALAFVAPGITGRRLAALALGLAVVRAAMLLAWAGSLLYLGLADGLVTIACAALGDRRRLVAFGASGVLSAGLAAPAVAAAVTPPGGPFSAITLSSLHLLACLGIGAAALALAALERARPARSPAARIGRLAGCGIALLALVAAWPAVREGLAPALRFVALRDAAGAVTYEQMPLFALFGRAPVQPPQVFFGAFAYAVLLAPVAAWLAGRDPRRRVPARLLAAWSGVLAALTVVQVRYGNDFAPAGAVAFALGLAALARALAAQTAIGRRTAGAAVALAALALVAWPTAPVRVRAARASLAAIGRPAPAGDPLLATPMGTLVRFARTVREVTPETPGYLAADGQPAWGVLSEPNIGHHVRHYARRPVAADNLWDKFPSFARAAGFLALEDEAAALDAAGALRVRYVLTAFGPPGERTLGARLDGHDGRATPDRPRLEHFRLVTEGPRGGIPLVDYFGMRSPPGTVPYKLWEIVPGALLEVPAPEGTPVSAELALATPAGRRFVYGAKVRAEGGVARLRVPYPSTGGAPVRAAGPWRIRAGSDIRHAYVSDADVAEGRTVRVEAATAP